ncbi:MAG TPA: thiosulfate oxidation carrier protein SoxY [Gemmatimonadaceae bacterium]|nr:thiosulfate oxidation carrier protein SoxY [Gemmatimonadaceae bacterium]
MLDARDLPRRAFFRRGAGALLALLLARLTRADALAAAALPDDDDPPEEVLKILRAKFGARPIRKGNVQLDAPEDAPDGRAVPLFIESGLPKGYDGWVKGVHILVDHNPDIYLAGFEFSAPPGGQTLDTRIKMRRTSYVRVVMETSRGELYTVAKKIFVTMNGCV